MRLSNILLCGSVLVMAIFLGWKLLWNPGSELDELKEKITLLEAENARSQQEINALKRECERLSRGDSSAVEKIARDRLGYCREGEVVYQMEEIDPGDPRIKKGASAKEPKK